MKSAEQKELNAGQGSVDAPPRISKPLWNWFSWYAGRFLRKNFHSVRIATDGLPPETPLDRPLIIYANHPSWWDPMVAILLARQVWPERSHYFPIDAAMLAKYRFFGRLGFFGVPSHGAGAGAAFLRQSVAVLSQERACLWVTPEGQFADVRKRPVVLRPGLAHLLRRLDRGLVLDAAIEYAFWTERTAEVLIRFGTPLALESRRGVAEWNELLSRRLEAGMDALARRSIERDSTQFRHLLRGRTGTSGIYDAWRRFRAMLAGRKFDASHLSEP